ncbi:MAG TPA: metallophosphoesterase [Clostridiales bacterium]|nr:metallophosphoesterase [Clostridiales bacterium]
MKVLIVSDTHGREKYLLDTIQRVSPIDMLIHLGDFEGGEESIRSMAGCSVEFVSGNNDFFTSIPKEKIIKVGNYSIMLTHGHRYSVTHSLNLLWEEAKRNYVDVVMYGHTHVPYIEKYNGIWFVNPGSISLPRQDGRPTFIIMDIDSKGGIHFTLNHIKRKVF